MTMLLAAQCHIGSKNCEVFLSSRMYLIADSHGALRMEAPPRRYPYHQRRQNLAENRPRGPRHCNHRESRRCRRCQRTTLWTTSGLEVCRTCWRYLCRWPIHPRCIHELQLSFFQRGIFLRLSTLTIAPPHHRHGSPNRPPGTTRRRQSLHPRHCSLRHRLSSPIRRYRHPHKQQVPPLRRSRLVAPCA